MKAYEELVSKAYEKTVEQISIREKKDTDTIEYMLPKSDFEQILIEGFDDYDDYDEFCEHYERVDMKPIFSKADFERARLITLIKRNEDILSGSGKINLDELDIVIEKIDYERINIVASQMEGKAVIKGPQINFTAIYKGQIIHSSEYHIPKEEDKRKTPYTSDILRKAISIVNKIHEQEQTSVKIKVLEDNDKFWGSEYRRSNEETMPFKANERRELGGEFKSLNFGLFSNEDLEVIYDNEWNVSNRDFDGRIYDFEVDEDSLLKTYCIDEQIFYESKNEAFYAGLNHFWDYGIDCAKEYLDDCLKEAGLFKDVAVIERVGKDFFIVPTVPSYDGQRRKYVEGVSSEYPGENALELVEIYQIQPKDRDFIINALDNIKEGIKEDMRQNLKDLLENYKPREEYEQEANTAVIKRSKR